MNFSILDQKEIRKAFADGEETAVVLFDNVTAHRAETMTSQHFEKIQKIIFAAILFFPAPQYHNHNRERPFSSLLKAAFFVQ